MNHLIGRRGLAISVALAAATAVTWSWWVVTHSEPQFSVVQPDATATTSNGAIYQLHALKVSDSVVSGWGQTLTPAQGAVFVTAEVHFDSRSASGTGLCTFLLHAGKATWMAESFSPPAPTASSCESGKSGEVAFLYQVPRSLAAGVDGVVVTDVGRPWQLLTGTPK